MAPRVTVAITTYNQAAYIGATIQSVLNQTYTDYEIVIVDDGSTDDTPGVVAQFGDRIRYIRQENRGVAGSRNRAVEESRGTLIALLDGDDLWDPPKLARQVQFYDEHPHVGLVAVECRLISTSGEVLHQEKRPRTQVFESPTVPYALGDFHLGFFEGCLIATTSQVMIPAAVLRDIGPSRPYRVSSDYDLYLRIACKYQVAFINEALASWRYLPTSASGPRALRELHWGSDGLDILRAHARGPGAGLGAEVIHARLERAATDVAYAAFQAGCRGEGRVARTHLWKVMQMGYLARPAAYFVFVSLPAPMREALSAAVDGTRATSSSRSAAQAPDSTGTPPTGAS